MIKILSPEHFDDSDMESAIPMEIEEVVQQDAKVLVVQTNLPAESFFDMSFMKFLLTLIEGQVVFEKQPERLLFYSVVTESWYSFHLSEQHGIDACRRHYKVVPNNVCVAVDLALNCNTHTPDPMTYLQ